MYIHKKGYSVIASIVTIVVLFFVLLNFVFQFTIRAIPVGLSVIGIIIIIWSVSFFRVPTNRKITMMDNAVVSSADGEIVAIEEVEERKLPLSEYELNIFERIKELNKSYDADEDYIFINEDGRRWQRGIDNTLRVLCREANIPEKSFHDIRRTVASEMYENGRTLEEIRDFLGHRDILTTQGYIYRLKRQSEYAQLVHESLKANELKLED